MINKHTRLWGVRRFTLETADGKTKSTWMIDVNSIPGIIIINWLGLKHWIKTWVGQLKK